MVVAFHSDPVILSSVLSALHLAALHPVTNSPTVMLYVGPDQIMPIASVFSAIVGVALMFWGRVVLFAHRCWTALVRRGQPPQQNSPVDRAPVDRA